MLRFKTLNVAPVRKQEKAERALEVFHKNF